MDDYALLYDKPAGVTSHDVVARVRRTLPRKTKVGHAGTLDPFATGLLLILVGRRDPRAAVPDGACPNATRWWPASARCRAPAIPRVRSYRTGAVPDGDLSCPPVEVRQRPPAYSAVKIGGRRAYELARAGIAG